MSFPPIWQPPRPPLNWRPVPDPSRDPLLLSQRKTLPPSITIVSLVIVAVVLVPLAVIAGIGLHRLATVPVSGPEATVRAFCMDEVQGNYADAYTWLAPGVTPDTQVEFVAASQARDSQESAVQSCTLAGRDIWRTIIGLHEIALSVTISASSGTTYPSTLSLDQATQKGGRSIWLIAEADSGFTLIPLYVGSQAH